MTGTIFTVNGSSASDAIKVPEADGKMRFWRNTTVATLAPGAVATLAGSTLGYEWDEELDNGFRPAGLVRLSSTTITGVQLLQDYGSTYAAGTATHRLTSYKHGSGALVFGAGTVQWSWGLDSNHDRGSNPADARMRQATVNLFADMGAQPATLQSGLVAATASTDTTAPSSTISSPTSGSNVPVGSPTTISGTATDAGGGVVGGVEVSVDGGVSWQPADGRVNWSYSWVPSASGNVTLKSRAADDSGNLGTPGPGVTVTVGSGTPNPCAGNTIWPATAVPAVAADPDTSAVEVGVKVRSNVSGTVCGVRFYKGSANTGTHVGKLWSSGGTLLAQATFTGETASGWQQVNFSSPVAITANAVYVASYHAPKGRYAVNEGFFTTPVDNPPLHALQDGVSGGNGVYLYGAGGFPANTFGSSNYWVDVVFNPAGPDTTAPTDPSNLSATATGASQINLTWSASTDNVGVSGYRVERCPGAGCSNFLQVATPTGASYPDSGLTAGTTYQYRVRATDAAGNVSGYSNVAAATTQLSNPPPGPPTGLSATASASGVALSWSANPEPDLAGYHAYRRPSGSGPFTRLNASLLATPAFEDTLAPSGTSDYTVTAVDTAGNESAQASSVSVTMALANRLLTPGFELDANNDTRPDSWSSNANFTRSNALARSGTYSGRHFATNNAGYTITQLVTGLAASATYTPVGWVNIPTTTDTFTLTLRVQWRNALNTVLRTDTIKAYTASTTGWNKALASLVAPSGTTNAQVQMVLSSLNATLYVDDFALR